MMKRTIYYFLIFICFCFFNNIHGQNLVEVNKTWAYLLGGEYPNDNPNNDMCYRIGNDTTISGFHYSEILTSWGCKESNWEIKGFIRETEDSIIYYLPVPDESEYLLYDFGVDIGDSVYTPYHTSCIDSIKLNDKGKKVYYLSGANNFSDRWIEGVGSEMGLLMEAITGGWMAFTCCLLNNEELYHNPNFEDCYYTTGLELPEQQKQLINIFINQDGRVVINSVGENHLNGNMQFYSLDGKHLTTKNLSVDGSVEICPPGNGILIYRFSNKEGEFQTGKICVP